MICIELLGSPAPQGSKKFVGMAGGRGVMVESSKKVRPWRQDVKAAAERVMAGRAPLDGPLVAVMTFTLPKPTSAPKRMRTWPCRKPDASKLARSTEDALTDAGVWTDDARIVSLVVHKVFPGEGRNALHSPGAVIEIYDVREVEVGVLFTSFVAEPTAEQTSLIPPRVAEDVFG
jgi:Holliday junction resolvase RusA-like endonuclease